jgi:hypothetical protein
MNPNWKLIQIQAEALTPFYYHGLYAPDGSMTRPDIVTDTAIVFALAYALGCPPTVRLRSEPDYGADLRRLPWRASLFMGAGNQGLAPVRHTIDVQREGGFQVQLQKSMRSGYFKNTFYVHEVTPGARYQGLLYGPDPFTEDELIVRVGVGRLGMLRLSKKLKGKGASFRLNTATAQLFGQTLAEDHRILDTIRVSRPYPLIEAGQILTSWQ